MRKRGEIRGDNTMKRREIRKDRKRNKKNKENKNEIGKRV